MGCTVRLSVPIKLAARPGATAHSGPQFPPRRMRVWMERTWGDVGRRGEGGGRLVLPHWGGSGALTLEPARCVTRSVAVQGPWPGSAGSPLGLESQTLPGHPFIPSVSDSFPSPTCADPPEMAKGPRRWPPGRDRPISSLEHGAGTGHLEGRGARPVRAFGGKSMAIFTSSVPS